ncbi:MAG TPA: hypothetical protein PKA98_00920 [Acidimicrobiales bacterium]|nr:hypothetical protein [Acidimicrobiales bacterium]
MHRTAGRTRPRWWRRRPIRVVVVVAADREAAAAHRSGRARRAARLVVTDPAGAARVAHLRLRRRDRVEWVADWHRGEGGDALARAVEAVGQAGGFGGARHAFADPEP